MSTIDYNTRNIKQKNNSSTIPRQFLAHAPLNRDDGDLLPDAYLHLVRKKKAANQ